VCGEKVVQCRGAGFHGTADDKIGKAAGTGVIGHQTVDW